MKKIKFTFSNIYLLMGAGLAFLGTILLYHVDALSISNWAYDLLTCVKNGDISGFPAYTYETHGLATNYSLAVNVINAIWLSPLFLIEQISTVKFSEFLFMLWYKILLLIVVAAGGKLFRDLLVMKGIDAEKRKIAVGLYFSSAIVSVAVLGKGQIDIYALFFLLLGTRYFLKEKYMTMSLLWGCAILIKPFPILMILPVLLLLGAKEKEGIFLYGLLTLVPFSMDKVITDICMPSYQTYVDMTSQAFAETFGFTRFSQLFSVSVGNIQLFGAGMFLICLYCYYLGRNDEVKEWHYTVFPALSYILLCAFESSTNYWYVCVLPLLIYMGMKYRKLSEVGLLLGINGFGTCFWMRLSNDGLPMARLLKPVSDRFPFLGNFCNRQLIFTDEKGYLAQFGITLFVMTMVAIVSIYTYEQKDLKYRGNDLVLKNWDKICLLIPAFVVFAYIIYQIV